MPLGSGGDFVPAPDPGGRGTGKEKVSPIREREVVSPE